jgi:hypothetical protein
MAKIREQVDHGAIEEKVKIAHLGWSVPHTAELVKRLTETAKIRHFVPHGNWERSLLFTGHGFVNLMTGCSGCHIFYKQQTAESMA